MLDWLIEIRKQKKVSQVYMAKNLGVTRQAYNHYETGRRKVPPEKAIIIGEVLEFPWEWFYKRDKNTS